MVRGEPSIGHLPDGRDAAWWTGGWIISIRHGRIRSECEPTPHLFPRPSPLTDGGCSRTQASQEAYKRPDDEGWRKCGLAPPTWPWMRV